MEGFCACVKPVSFNRDVRKLSCLYHTTTTSFSLFPLLLGRKRVMLPPALAVIASKQKLMVQ